MSSICQGIRASGRRCVACNQSTTAWLCSGCGFSSSFYSARFNDDTKASTVTSVGRRNMYPKPWVDYHSLGTAQPLNPQERTHLMHEWKDANEDQGPEEGWEPGGWESKWRDSDVHAYDRFVLPINANNSRNRTDRFGDHLSFVRQEDPRRFCEECIAHRRHREGCPLILLDGLFVGGYVDDGLQRSGRPRFTKLRSPGRHWTRMHHRQHARAVRVRWAALVTLWAKIGLDLLTRSITGGAIK